MAAMIHRTTFALDARTTARIKQLACTWGVSQAEVIRRSVRVASELKSALSPAEVVAHYASSAPLRSEKEVRRLAESVRKLRHADDARRARK